MPSSKQLTLTPTRPLLSFTIEFLPPQSGAVQTAVQLRRAIKAHKYVSDLLGKHHNRVRFMIYTEEEGGVEIASYYDVRAVYCTDDFTKLPTPNTANELDQILNTHA